MPTPAEPPVLPTKRALREEILAARGRRSQAESADAAEAIAEHVLAWDAVRRANTVAAYFSIGGEPGTRVLLDSLIATGKRVLLPVVLTDFDLDWVEYTGELVPATYGLLEPVGPRLGAAGIAEADVALVPGLAASATGDRLGRGAGCYDRAMARIGAEVPIGILLHEDEAGRDVPTEPHDRRVTHVVTPAGIVGC